MEKEIEKIIIQSILNTKYIKDINQDQILFGSSDALFDSVGLVMLLIEIEEALYDKFKLAISLSDEKAMSSTSSPFATIKTLSRYIKKQIDE